MVAPQFVPLDEDAFEYGRVDQVSPLIRRVIADNPSKFTYRGTGTYIVGAGDVVVIDPGPRLDSHRDFLARALDGETVRAILVTHCHADHSPLAAWMKEWSGAPTYAFGPHPRPTDDEIVEDFDDDAGDDTDDGNAGRGTGEVKIEEATDYDFAPDVAVADGETVVELPGITMAGVHTPGHTSNHMCWTLAEERALFTGDHVMGWSTTVVSPPDGDMSAYIDSLQKVAGRGDSILWPTHGSPRTDGAAYVQALVDHRLEREAGVLDLVRSGVTSIKDMVDILYADLRKELHKPARRSVWGHLVKLVDNGRVTTADGGRPVLKSTYVAT